MELGPKIMGKKNKSIRNDPTQLEAFREELKSVEQWAEYAAATDSELVRIAVIFGRIHIAPDIYVLTLDAVQQLIDDAIRLNIGEVAKALGGVAQLNPDKTITVARPEGESVETFPATPPDVQRPTLLH